jgi:hypothetical protein
MLPDKVREALGSGHAAPSPRADGATVVRTDDWSKRFSSATLWVE